MLWDWHRPGYAHVAIVATVMLALKLATWSTINGTKEHAEGHSYAKVNTEYTQFGASERSTVRPLKPKRAAFFIFILFSPDPNKRNLCSISCRLFLWGRRRKHGLNAHRNSYKLPPCAACRNYCPDEAQRAPN